MAAEAASALHAPLDVLVVRKLGCPWQPELGFGAIGEGGVRVVNAPLIEMLNISQEQLDQVVARGERGCSPVHRYRGDRPPVGIEGRTVILVDDGLATGFTARAAISYAARRSTVLLAVPVAPAETLEHFELSQGRRSGSRPRITSLASGSSTWTSRRPRTRRWRHSWQVPQPPFPEPTCRRRTRPPALKWSSVRSTSRDPDRAGASGGDRGLRAWQRQQQVEPRNLAVAQALNRVGFATLLFDLLTCEEEQDRANVFDVELLGERLIDATKWLRERSDLGHLPIAYFGASTGAAAALWTAAELRHDVAAVISRGGRPTWRHAGSPTCSHRRC